MLQLLTALLNLFKRPKGPSGPPSISPDYPPTPAALPPAPTPPAPPKTPVSLPEEFRPDEWAGITVEGLMAIGVSRSNAEKHSPALNRACSRFNIKSHARICGFLAQVCHESSYLSVMRENLNYRPDALMTVFEGRFTQEQADRYGYIRGVQAADQKMIASIAYASRIGNGPIHSSDGWTYRGRGFIQLTGKANYIECGKAIGVDLVGDPSKAESSEVAALAAAWFFSVRGCSAISDADSEDAVKRVTKVVNGARNGLEDRLAIWRKARRAFPHLK